MNNKIKTIHKHVIAILNNVNRFFTTGTFQTKLSAHISKKCLDLHGLHFTLDKQSGENTQTIGKQ